jgi:mono/diheme cytochrome c family protein
MKKGLMRLEAFIAAAVVLVSPIPSLAGEKDEAAANGLKLVEAKCARCHAVGAEGASPLEKAPPFRDVVLRYPVANLAEALAEGIVTGHPDMPEFVFEPSDIEAILAYLDGLKPLPGK